jgi:hypothetical protein
MTDLGPNWITRGNPIGRRCLFESCVGIVAGVMAMQKSPALETDSPANFYPGFRRQTVQTSGTTINVVVGGNGPPVLLLHG